MEDGGGWWEALQTDDATRVAVLLMAWLDERAGPRGLTDWERFVQVSCRTRFGSYEPGHADQARWIDHLINRRLRHQIDRSADEPTRQRLTARLERRLHTQRILEAHRLADIRKNAKRRAAAQRATARLIEVRSPAC